MSLESKIFTVIVLIWVWFLIFKFKTFDKMAIEITKKHKISKLGMFFLSSTFHKIAYVFFVIMAILVIFASER